MKTIASFTVDHDKLKPGLYLSRRDRNTYTLDIRLVKPNTCAIAPGALHTIEHLAATFLRNSSISDSVVYFGPMGCLTGCYLVLFDDVSEDKAAKAVEEAFGFVAGYEGMIPGASSSKECGNWKLHDLPGAKAVASEYLKSLCGKVMTY
ncbi:S-ribosylhomocysteine lyase [bioreactor metagenome]|uniref:S-ribosylhomocysteine lyase n=1 Tax=bioreactor metagenome TaxID=1076179 RepID=A0A645DEG3_9ZZZZ|nr:S-ribosylhomocysteine lyase [Oscillospiraceae bacterium]